MFLPISSFSIWNFAWIVLLAGAAAPADPGAPAPDNPAIEKHSAAEWLQTALAETRQQKQWESDHPLDGELFLGAGKYVREMYGKLPDAAFVVGTPQFIDWWKNTGSAGLEQWGNDDFPMIIDRDHLIDNTIALYSAQNTPRTSKTLYVNGHAFSKPDRLWAYYDRIKKTGTEAYCRGCSGEKLSRDDYNLLRLFAPIVYSMWGAPYLPYETKTQGRHLTAGDVNYYPVPGMEAPDFTLPRLASILRSPAYTDAYSFDYRRPFHSEIAAFLLYVCDGYVPIPKQEQLPDSPLIKAKPYQCDDPQSVTLSTSRAKKPVLLVFNDPIDGYWESTVPLMEPLYRATKERIDWYFICDDIGDNIFWNQYYFPPNQGTQTFQKAISMEERAQIAKNALSMQFSNLSFPVLLDDLAQHAQNAYADQGGIAKVFLIDKKGIIAMNSRLWPEPRTYTEQGEFGFRKLTQVHSVVSANVKTLLDNNGLWNGKPAVVPDWQPPAALENVKMANVDAKAGTITVPGADGRDLVVAVDKGTRIIFSSTPDICKSFGDLTIGTVISLTYELGDSAAGRTARLILSGAKLNDYITNPLGANYHLWCPAIATAVSDSVITAALSPRAKSEMQGLKFWEEAKSLKPTWEATMVQDWINHADQTLIFHVDRATEVIINGAKGKISDIQVGDHLGVEVRQDQTADHRRPFFIFVYRYGTADAENRKNGLRIENSPR